MDYLVLNGKFFYQQGLLLQWEAMKFGIKLKINLNQHLISIVKVNGNSIKGMERFTVPKSTL
jgi:hypothetical protein